MSERTSFGDAAADPHEYNGQFCGGGVDFLGRGVALIFSPSRKRNTNSTRESASVVILSGKRFVSLFVVVPSKKISRTEI